jgi:hypothetical protein
MSLFAYDSASQQLVIFPPAVAGAVPLAFRLVDLQKQGWTITHAGCVASLPRADRAMGRPSPIVAASAQDLRNLKR